MDNYLKDNLKAIRKSKNMTQTQFADLLGVNQSNVLRWESGERAPSLEALINISKKLNISLDTLTNNKLIGESNFILDDNHVLDSVIFNKTKDLSDEDKKKIIDLIDVYKK